MRQEVCRIEKALRRLAARVNKIERFKGWRVRYDYLQKGQLSPRTTELFRDRAEAREWLRQWSTVYTISKPRIVRVYRKVIR
jgi:hypothetical protein